MKARHGNDPIERSGGRLACHRRRAPLAAALLALLMLCGLFGAAAPAGAATKPGVPTAKAPTGTVTTATPTFTWSKAKGAAKYELRVYQGSTMQFQKTGITKLSWKSTALPKNVRLSWKVRASNAAGAGAWSKSLALTIVTGESAKAITAFSFEGLTPAVTGAIDEAAHTIALKVPPGTQLTALAATFTSTGASVAVGATPQVSGTTANDFTQPLTYTVTATDSSTQAYVVTVTAGALAIGDPYQGGKIAYILQEGDPGYVAGQTHGLIAATADQSTGIRWWNGRSIVTGATGEALGTGSANTTAIINAQGAVATSYAAGLARAYRGGGYSDWYLPCQAELNLLYLSKAALGGFGSGAYWTSTEYRSDVADCQYFNDGHTDGDAKDWAYRVRAVRSF